MGDVADRHALGGCSRINTRRNRLHIVRIEVGLGTRLWKDGAGRLFDYLYFVFFYF